VLPCASSNETFCEHPLWVEQHAKVRWVATQEALRVRMLVIDVDRYHDQTALPVRTLHRS
jgi:hypothetical protein